MLWGGVRRLRGFFEGCRQIFWGVGAFGVVVVGFGGGGGGGVWEVVREEIWETCPAVISSIIDSSAAKPRVGVASKSTRLLSIG